MAENFNAKFAVLENGNVHLSSTIISANSYMQGAGGLTQFSDWLHQRQNYEDLEGKFNELSDRIYALENPEVPEPDYTYRYAQTWSVNSYIKSQELYKSFIQDCLSGLYNGDIESGAEALWGSYTMPYLGEGTIPGTFEGLSDDQIKKYLLYNEYNFEDVNSESEHNGNYKDINNNGDLVRVVMYEVSGPNIDTKTIIHIQAHVYYRWVLVCPYFFYYSVESHDGEKVIPSMASYYASSDSVYTTCGTHNGDIYIHVNKPLSHIGTINIEQIS